MQRLKYWNLLLGCTLLTTAVACKSPKFIGGSQHRTPSAGPSNPPEDGGRDGSAGGDEDGIGRDDGGNTPDNPNDPTNPSNPNNPNNPNNPDKPSNPGKPVPPDNETPGKSEFHNCLDYDKTKTPIRVDVYAVPDNYRQQWQGIVNSACGQDGLYEDCYDPWRAMKVIEWNQDTTYKPANKLTQFCMTHYDVGQRKFSDGFPKNDGGSTKIERDEWFAFDSWVYLKIPIAGQYQFSMISDDGSRLRIDNQEIINYDGAHETAPLDNPRTPIGSVNLTAGKHELLLRYFQGPRDIIALQLFWKTPQDQTWKVVPKDAFEYWDK